MKPVKYTHKTNFEKINQKGRIKLIDYVEHVTQVSINQVLKDYENTGRLDESILNVCAYPAVFHKALQKPKFADHLKRFNKIRGEWLDVYRQETERKIQDMQALTASALVDELARGGKESRKIQRKVKETSYSPEGEILGYKVKELNEQSDTKKPIQPSLLGISGTFSKIDRISAGDDFPEHAVVFDEVLDFDELDELAKAFRAFEDADVVQEEPYDPAKASDPNEYKTVEQKPVVQEEQKLDSIAERKERQRLADMKANEAFLAKRQADVQKREGREVPRNSDDFDEDVLSSSDTDVSGFEYEY